MDMKEVAKFETPVKLKLSEAIRIGAQIRPQCKGRAFRDGGSCAMGAAYEAMTGNVWPEDDFGNFPLIMHDFGAPTSIVMRVTNMNDNGMTREQIADWLESQGY